MDLIIDTTSHRAVAVRAKSQACVGLEATMERGLGEWLHDAVRQLLPEPRGLERIVVAVGPGSYTGIRIGLAYATGLALTTGARLQGIERAQVLLHRLRCGGAPPGSVISAFDSKRSDVYAQLHRYENGAYVAASALMVVEDQDQGKVLGPWLEEGAVVVGDGKVLGWDGAVEAASFEDYACACACSELLCAPEPLYVLPPKVTPPKVTLPT